MMEVPPERLEEILKKVKKIEEKQKTAETLSELLKKPPKGRILAIKEEIVDMMREVGLEPPKNHVVENLKEVRLPDKIKALLEKKIVYSSKDEKEIKKLAKTYRKLLKNTAERLKKKKEMLLEEYFKTVIGAIEAQGVKFDVSTAKTLAEKKAHRKILKARLEVRRKRKKGEKISKEFILKLFT